MSPTWKRQLSIPDYISAVVPECAQQCTFNSVQSGYSGRCEAIDRPCLCSKYTKNGYTLGELALKCLYSPTCSDTARQNSTSVYSICAGSAIAAVPTHKALTASVASIATASAASISQLPSVQVVTAMPSDNKITPFQIAGITIAAIALLVAIVGMVLCTLWLRKRRAPIQIEDLKAMCEGLSHQDSVNSTTGLVTKERRNASSSRGRGKRSRSGSRWPKYYGLSPPSQSQSNIQVPAQAHLPSKEPGSAGERKSHRSSKKANLHLVLADKSSTSESVAELYRLKQQQKQHQEQQKPADKGKGRQPPAPPIPPPKSPQRNSRGPPLSIQIPPNTSPAPEKVRHSRRDREGKAVGGESSSSAQKSSTRKSLSIRRSYSAQRTSSKRSSSLRRFERGSKALISTSMISKPIDNKNSWGRASFASYTQSGPQSARLLQRSSTNGSDPTQKSTPQQATPLFQARDGLKFFSVQSLQNIHPAERASAMSTEWHPPVWDPNNPPSFKPKSQPIAQETPSAPKDDEVKAAGTVSHSLRRRESATSIESCFDDDEDDDEEEELDPTRGFMMLTKAPAPIITTTPSNLTVPPSARSPIADLTYPRVPSSSNNKSTLSIIPRAASASPSTSKSVTPPPQFDRISPAKALRTPDRSDSPETVRPTPSPRTPTYQGRGGGVTVVGSVGSTPASYRSVDGGFLTAGTKSPPQFGLKGERKEKGKDGYEFF